MSTRKLERTDRHSGSTFDSFLDEQGIRGEVEAVAIKRVLAWQLQREMAKQKKTKRMMARQLRTSRSQLDRLLDPTNSSVTLASFVGAAGVLGKRVVFRVTSSKARRAR